MPEPDGRAGESPLAIDFPLILDGGLGLDLRRRLPDADRSLLPVEAMHGHPEIVQAAHEDFIRAGAGVITTNTYATVRARLAEHTNLADDWRRLMEAAGKAAKAAVVACRRPVRIAGCLPPLHGSYRPDKVAPYDAISPVYREHVAALTPFVDVFLCETMSNGAEGFAAAEAALDSGKPVWVSWTLADDGSGRLRSGETLAEAYDALQGLPIEAAMINCSAPETLTAAMPALVALGVPLAGGHANGFTNIPANWSVGEGINALGERRDLDPEAYADHALGWIGAGARIVGGCCGVGPDHIAAIARRLGSTAV